MNGAGAKLLLVGCGKMGAALLRGVAAAGFVSDIAVVEPSPLPENLKNLPNMSWHASPDTLPSSFVADVVLIAVKPQMMAEALPPYARFKDAVFLSIAAGVTQAKLADLLGNPAVAIVRSMPNLPASIGQGATVAVPNQRVSAHQKELCDKILRAAGTVFWASDEGLLDVVTALSGSGPAYVFALCEAMEAAGKAMGLPPDMARQLARQTIIGSGALMSVAEESAENLRRAVTSPKGTTEAALKILQADPGLNDLVQKAMQAAAARAAELAR